MQKKLSWRRSHHTCGSLKSCSDKPKCVIFNDVLQYERNSHSLHYLTLVSWFYPKKEKKRKTGSLKWLLTLTETVQSHGLSLTDVFDKEKKCLFCLIGQWFWSEYLERLSVVHLKWVDENQWAGASWGNVFIPFMLYVSIYRQKIHK